MDPCIYSSFLSTGSKKQHQTTKQPSGNPLTELHVFELFKPPKPCFMGNGSMLILKVMPDVSSPLCLLCFICDSSHECDEILFECSLYKMFYEIFMSFVECVNNVCY